MREVEDIILYLRSLKKGFDKDLFTCKVNDLGYVVETIGLNNYDEFHTLFKVWLNLNIPLAQWTSIGICLVPNGKIDIQTFEYALFWILDNSNKTLSIQRIAFVLDWLTAAMDADAIDKNTLQMGYEILYSRIAYEALVTSSMKLVYTLTKPVHVTRWRVREVLEYAKFREQNKNMYRHHQVLLGLFKSYRPECVPEEVPAISINTSFKKVNEVLVYRFQKWQAARQSIGVHKLSLLWTNPMGSARGKGKKKADPLVPVMDFCHIGSNQYGDKKTKNYLEFTDPQELISYSVSNEMARASRLRAHLSNVSGITLLILLSDTDHEFLSHDLQHLLTGCFLYDSTHSYAEKRDFLYRLALLQRTILQGIPVVTRFLAQYLPLWDERRFFGDILELVEWVNVDCPEHVKSIVECLQRTYHRVSTLRQCAVLNAITNMYSNLVYGSTRKRQYFMSMPVNAANYTVTIAHVSAAIADMCNKALQVNPEDMRVLWSSVLALERSVRIEALTESKAVAGTVPAPLTLAIPLLSPSPFLLDKMAALVILYKKMLMKPCNRDRKDQTYIAQMQILKAYTLDLIRCFYCDQAFSDRHSGYVFKKLRPEFIEKLNKALPGSDSALALRHHLAFAAYTYIRNEVATDLTNRQWFRVLSEEFRNLGKFLMKALPELRES